MPGTEWLIKKGLLREFVSLLELHKGGLGGSRARGET